MRYIGIIICMCIFVLFIGGCSHNNKTTDIVTTDATQSTFKISKVELEEAKETIVNYIKALNDNNYDEYLRYLGSSSVKSAEQNRIKHNSVPKYEYARVIKITPDTSIKSRDAYLKYGRGKGTNSSKVAIFQVVWEYKLTPNGIDKDEDKKIEWKYILVKAKENDAWKIDDFGY